MDIWINTKQENKLRKEDWTIPARPKNGYVYFKGKRVGFISDFVGLSIENDKTEAITFLVDNADRLNLCLWNIPKKESV